MMEISIENRLRDIALENPEYDGLWSTWDLNKKAIQPILNAIIKDYPHYSMHDYSHSDSILSNIERLLGSERIGMLSPTDLWLILHVAYLHDFGMVIIDSRMLEFWEDENFQHFIKEQQEGNDEDAQKAANIILNIKDFLETECTSWPIEVKKAVTLLLSKYCRKYHAHISKDYIIDQNIWSLDLGHNGLVKKRLIGIMGEISSLHTANFNDVMQLPKTSNGFKNDYMHPRFVACMLRIGDVLDLDNGRFHEYTEQIFGTFPKESYNHYKKHESTKHILVTPEVIEVEADCHESAVYRETRKWFDSIKAEIENLQLHWNDIAPEAFGRPPKLSSCKLLRDGNPDIYGLSELKLHISQKKAFEILEGSSIYKSKLACIRELIQNAEDASKIQLWRDINKGLYYSHNGIDEEKVINNELTPFDIPSWVYDIYTIDVDVVKTDEGNVKVLIKDHGTGVSIDSLRNICNVGESYFIKHELTKEIESMPIWLRPTASFGIGLQSCFMATNQFVITTKSESSDALKIIFESGKEEGYVNAEIIPDKNFRGSEVLIEFPGNMNFTYDMFGLTAEKIREIDPFESNCLLVYRAIEEIYKTCGNSFFSINIHSKEIAYDDIIKSYFAEMRNVNRNELYCFDADKAELKIWYNNSFYTVKFLKIGHGYIDVNFKGKKVHKTKYLISRNFVGLDIRIDIYGMSTKKALSLDRDELSADATRELNENLYLVIKKYLGLVSQTIIKEKKYNFLIPYALCAWLYEMEMIDLDIKEVPQQKICSLVRGAKEFEIKYINFGDIYEQYPKIAFIKEDIVKQQFGNPTAITEEQLLSQINKNFDSIHEKYIIIDSTLCEYLKVGYSKIQYLRDSSIAIHTMNNGELYEPDDYTRSELIKQLVFNSKITRNNFCIERRAIPAIKSYENIAVGKHIPFVFSEEDSKWKIISPISYEDSKKIWGLSEDEFVEYIIKQPTFANLVEYTLNNSQRDDISKETVISEYKRLITEYYKQAKNNPN